MYSTVKGQYGTVLRRHSAVKVRYAKYSVMVPIRDSKPVRYGMVIVWCPYRVVHGTAMTR